MARLHGTSGFSVTGNMGIPVSVKVSPCDTAASSSAGPTGTDGGGGTTLPTTTPTTPPVVARGRSDWTRIWLPIALILAILLGGAGYVWLGRVDARQATTVASLDRHDTRISSIEAKAPQWDTASHWVATVGTPNAPKWDSASHWVQNIGRPIPAALQGVARRSKERDEDIIDYVDESTLDLENKVAAEAARRRAGNRALRAEVERLDEEKLDWVTIDPI